MLPDVFDGAKNWDEWSEHFDSVAAVNGWEEAAKLKWLRVRLTGRAATTFRRLPEATRADFTTATEALRKRFEPDSKRELYMAQLQTRRRRRKEDWMSFAEDLKLLADKAYPSLQEEARERLALNQYLNCLDDPQIAFSVRQSKPTLIDDAVRVTLEMESYQRSSDSMPVRVRGGNGDTDSTVIASVATRGDILQLILERMDRLEAVLSSRAAQEEASCWENECDEYTDLQQEQPDMDGHHRCTNNPWSSVPGSER